MRKIAAWWLLWMLVAASWVMFYCMPCLLYLIAASVALLVAAIYTAATYWE